ncbi:FAD-binding oxidoreductase [Spirosoma aerolatum]|uniref:FAD-binding oxidoreductase n=1 Tax=Spirosoma aerolatum TaxID=1211326 RepID=UPI0009AE9DB5|nr:FAD-binding oxidoreductase [Spirosoma aerolatum]
MEATVNIHTLFRDIPFFSPDESASYKQNITEYQSKELLGRVQPLDSNQVTKLVQIANHAEIALYPYSSGMNWGQGSKVPMADHSLLVDLSRLNQIIELNERFGYVILEAGVTQGQLAEFLLDTPFKLPVTGSAVSTSVVGNLLERGTTAFNHRNSLLLGVEAVLGNGKVIRTGLWHYASEQQSHPPISLSYAKGLGPDLNGLFTQSNIGIVTKVILKLLPRRNGIILHAETNEARLSSLVDTLYKLGEDHITRGWALVTNKNDPRTTTPGQYAYTGDWFILSSIEGANSDITQQQLIEARKRLEPICHHVDFIATDDHERIHKHPFFSILVNLYNGIPSNYSLDTMAQMAGISLNNSYAIDQNITMPGFSVVLPAVPFDGESIRKVMDTVQAVSSRLGVHTFYNFGTVDNYTFEGFYRVYFDRNDAKAVAKAHRWNKEVHLALEQIGVYPYRNNIGMMDHFTNRPDDDFWATIQNIKVATDPNGVIAPGRYCIPTSGL